MGDECTEFRSHALWCGPIDFRHGAVFLEPGLELVVENAFQVLWLCSCPEELQACFLVSNDEILFVASVLLLMSAQASTKSNIRFLLCEGWLKMARFLRRTHGTYMYPFKDRRTLLSFLPSLYNI